MCFLFFQALINYILFNENDFRNCYGEGVSLCFGKMCCCGKKEEGIKSPRSPSVKSPREDMGKELNAATTLTTNSEGLDQVKIRF